MNRRNNGFALILVIWSLVLLASLATGFAYSVRHQIRAAADMAATARAEAAATAALHTVILTFSSPESKDRWPVDGKVRPVAWPDATVSVRVRSESGRIDINRASRELLHGLFSLLFSDKDPDALTDALIDWRDKDNRVGAAGAELEDYSRAGYPYGPANAALYSVNELSQVMGFDGRMVELAKPYITVYSRRPKIHAASADLLVLTAVPGIDRDAAQDFVAQREHALGGDNELDYTRLRNGRRYLDTKSSNSLLSIDIDVRLNEGTRHRERAVVNLQRNRGYKMLARESLPIGDMPHASANDGR